MAAGDKTFNMGCCFTGDANSLQVSKQIGMLGRTRKDIIVHQDYDENIATVEVDSVQIEQVFLNLYVNVSHAMPSGGKEAIEIIAETCINKMENPSKRPDLVILDMIMLDIGGGDVFDRIRGIDPEIKVLLASGYSVNGMASEIINRGCNGFIQKPFKIELLSKKIREIIDEKDIS